jgi:hypothetical protein
MEDLITWLRAQIDKDEQIAKASDQVRHREIVTEVLAKPIAGTHRQAAHIAYWDSARVLALTTALRAIIDSFSWEAQETRAVRILAEALYADRPGYRDEWRP